MRDIVDLNHDKNSCSLINVYLCKKFTPVKRAATLQDVSFAGYNSSLAIAEAKQRKTDAQKKYKQLKKNPRPKLYDKPPHLIK